MDTVEDADELGYEDEETVTRRPLLGVEAYAVAALTLSVCSFFASGLLQLLPFLFGEVLGLGDSEWQQVVLFIGPTAVVALVSVGLGITALRRDDAQPWLRGVAGGAVIVSTLVLAICVVGAVAVLVTDSPAGMEF